MKLRPMLAAIAFVLCFSLVLPSFTIAHPGHGHYKKPNVIIFMADDLGQDAVPLYNPDDSELVQQRRRTGKSIPRECTDACTRRIGKKMVLLSEMGGQCLFAVQLEVRAQLDCIHQQLV